MAELFPFSSSDSDPEKNESEAESSESDSDSDHESRSSAAVVAAVAAPFGGPVPDFGNPSKPVKVRQDLQGTLSYLHQQEVRHHAFGRRQAHRGVPFVCVQNDGDDDGDLPVVHGGRHFSPAVNRIRKMEMSVSLIN